MMSLELLLDPAAEQRVRADWSALLELGVSSMAAHTAESNRPHITLVVRQAVAPADAASLAAHVPIEVELGAPVLFGDGDRRVLARLVVPSRPLLALHAAAHLAVGAGEDAPHTAPDDWTPHVTLARRLRLSDLPAALARLEPSAGTATIRVVRHWDGESRVVTPVIG